MTIFLYQLPIIRERKILGGATSRLKMAPSGFSHNRILGSHTVSALVNSTGSSPDFEDVNSIIHNRNVSDNHSINFPSGIYSPVVSEDVYEPSDVSFEVDESGIIKASNLLVKDTVHFGEDLQSSSSSISSENTNIVVNPGSGLIVGNTGGINISSGDYMDFKALPGTTFTINTVQERYSANGQTSNEDVDLLTPAQNGNTLIAILTTEARYNLATHSTPTISGATFTLIGSTVSTSSPSGSKIRISMWYANVTGDPGGSTVSFTWGGSTQAAVASVREVAGLLTSGLDKWAPWNGYQSSWLYTGTTPTTTQSTELWIGAVSQAAYSSQNLPSNGFARNLYVKVLDPGWTIYNINAGITTSVASKISVNTGTASFSVYTPNYRYIDSVGLMATFKTADNPEQAPSPDSGSVRVFAKSIPPSTETSLFAKTDRGNEFQVGAPTGSVISFAGLNAPDGWLMCDGSSISRTDYEALFQAIGTSWGEGDGSTTFTIPDLRGRFIKGVEEFYPVGELGGQSSHNHAVQIFGSTDAESSHVHSIPSHQHIIQQSNDHSHYIPATTGTALNVGGTGSNAARYNHAHTSNDAGSHAHGGSTGSQTFTNSGTSSHSHTLQGSYGTADSDYNDPFHARLNWIIKT